MLTYVLLQKKKNTRNLVPSVGSLMLWFKRRRELFRGLENDVSILVHFMTFLETAETNGQQYLTLECP